jgi:hypothetical protein
MYLSVKNIDFVAFYDLSVGFWDCSDSMIFLLFLIHFLTTEFENVFTL